MTENNFEFVKNAFIALLAVVLSSCVPSKEERIEFREYYDYRVSELVEYDNMFSDTGCVEIHLNDWMNFLENCSYLEALTGCELHYNRSEPPCYENKGALSADTAALMKWYAENGEQWTMKRADKYVYKKRKGHTVYF